MLAVQLVSLSAHAQPLTIPLQYVQVQNGPLRLGINVGINSGPPLLYEFNTGSSLFNAIYNTSPGAPASFLGSSGTGVSYCYGAGICFNGNLVQVPTLNFYAPAATAGSTPAATLSASPGFQINAVYSQTSNSNGALIQAYPTGSTAAPYEGMYGIFGAGNFASIQSAANTSLVIVGGVFGQAQVSGVTHQGFVVSANGQPNPWGPGNPPTGSPAVLISGRPRPVSSCNPCVTVGLTPQLIGQFAPVGLPTPGANQTGVVPTATSQTNSSIAAFPNPYSIGGANPASTEGGLQFTTALTPTSGAAASTTTWTLLDTGTPNFALTSNMNNGASLVGATLAMAGATLAGGSIAGLPTTSATLNGNGGYVASFPPNSPGTILGLPFFLQNSVMFDLTGAAVGYTPFYVTTSNFALSAGEQLIVAGTPLGLAGAVSGTGGVVVASGGALQLSATNTYTGATTIVAASGSTPAGQLLISGPGSIASSSGVANNGTFDISRSWSPVSIQSLTGSGQVNLGGQNLTVTNGSGTFSGTIGDGGNYPAAGGTLTFGGGSTTLAGTATHTGGTTVSGGTLTLASPVPWRAQSTSSPPAGSSTRASSAPASSMPA